jgi:hypothetical protein
MLAQRQLGPARPAAAAAGIPRCRSATTGGRQQLSHAVVMTTATSPRCRGAIAPNDIKVPTLRLRASAGRRRTRAARSAGRDAPARRRRADVAVSQARSTTSSGRRRLSIVVVGPALSLPLGVQQHRRAGDAGDLGLQGAVSDSLTAIWRVPSGRCLNGLGSVPRGATDRSVARHYGHSASPGLGGT